MFQTEASISIDRTPAQVFAWLSDPNKVMQWVPNMIENNHVPAKDSVIGTEFQQTFRVRGRLVRSTGSIVDYVQDTKIAIAMPRDRFCLSAVYTLHGSDQSTTVRQQVMAEFRGWAGFVSRVAGVLLRPFVRVKIRRNLKSLKTICESEPRRDPPPFQHD